MQDNVMVEILIVLSLQTAGCNIWDGNLLTLHKTFSIN